MPEAQGRQFYHHLSKCFAFARYAPDFFATLRVPGRNWDELARSSASESEYHPAVLGGVHLNPLEQTPGEVDAHNRAAFVTSEKAALPLQTAVRDHVSIRVARQQTDVGRRRSGGGSVFAAARISGLMRTSSLSTDPSVPMVSVMELSL